MSRTVVKGRFAVDTDGLRYQMRSREPWRLVQEIVSNSFDEQTASYVVVTIDRENDLTRIRILDNGKGFENIQDTYTLFGYSKKVQNVNQRGRFNLGEKQFFAVANRGEIVTSGKKITFKEDERVEEDFKQSGTEITAYFDWTENQAEQIVKMLRRIIVPDDKILVVNEVRVKSREVIRTFEDTLPTLIPSRSDIRVLSETERKSKISLHEVDNGEKPWLYEMGIPVQHINALWHVNVDQKIPLSPNRDTVRDSYLKTLYAAILNNAHDLIPEEKTGNDFVTIGLGGANAESARAILQKRFEADDVYLKSGNSRSNEAAIEAGGYVIGDRVFDQDTKSHLMDLGIVRYASAAFPTTLVRAERVKVTKAMERFAEVVKRIAKDTIKKDIEVRFVSAPDSCDVAQYGSGIMTFNVGHGVVGEKWFEQFTAENIGVVIHELSHDKAPNDAGFSHFSTTFIHEIERIAGEVAIKGLSYYLRE